MSSRSSHYCSQPERAYNSLAHLPAAYALKMCLQLPMLRTKEPETMLSSSQCLANNIRNLFLIPTILQVPDQIKALVSLRS